MGERARSPVALAAAWLKAGEDLGVGVVAPYQLEGLEFVVLVRDFGGPNGMLILESWDPERAAVAERAGFGYSCMDSPFYQIYRREVFVEALTDWRWTGDPAAKPNWYLESGDGNVNGRGHR
jgi:hypothetical protein